MTIASLFLALIVTSAADTSNGEPVLLDFHASWCGPCRDMRPEIAKLAQKDYPIKSVDIDRSPDLAERYDVTAVPTFIVADSRGNVLARTKGFQPAADLARMYNDAKLKYDATLNAPRGVELAATTQPSGDDSEDVADPAQDTEAPPRSNPKPWETVVRIKMHLSSKEWGFGSGTIIYSDAEESIILTCAHIFRDKNGKQQQLKNFQTAISVDLFDGKITSLKPAMLHCIQKDIPGEAIDYDFNNDVGLIRIRPGRKLPYSRVVPDTWQPKRGAKMYSVGCSHGNDATAWDTQILEPSVKMNSSETRQPFYEMKCKFQPSEGRSGGGLYTTEGFVAGVCDFADPNEKVGLYAVPTAIHKLLDRNQMTAYYKPISGSDRMLAATNRNQPLIRAQSPANDEVVATRTSPFTVPPPGMFGITSPEAKVASATNRSWPARSSESIDAINRKPGAIRRPDRNSGEVFDPGANPDGTITTDLALEPPAEALALEGSDTPTPPSKPKSGAASTRSSMSHWKPVNRARPDRPSPQD